MRVIRFECDADNARVLFPGTRRNEPQQRQQEQGTTDDIDGADTTEFPAGYSGLRCVAGLLYFDCQVSAAWNLVLQRGCAGRGAVDQDIRARGI